MPIRKSRQKPIDAKNEGAGRPRVRKNGAPLSVTGYEVIDKKCRKCLQTKTIDHYYTAVDNGFIDADGYLSVCKEDIDDMLDNFMLTEGTIERAMLKLCRWLNVRYDEEAIAVAQKHINTMVEKGKAPSKFFGIYKQKIVAVQKTEMGGRQTQDLIFEEPTKAFQGEYTDVSADATAVRNFWGDGFIWPDDYAYLESQFSEWSKSHRIDTQSEKTLLKFICLKELEIRKAIAEGKNTSTLIKDFQELLKTSALSPSSSTVSSAGKSQETWGNFVKMVEEQEPCEVYKDQKLFAGFDNIEYYFNKFILRPLRNFITGSRDFNISEDDSSDYDFDEPEDETPQLEYKVEEE